MTEISIQDTYFPDSVCFGCGPTNADGLLLKSFVAPDGTVVAEYEPASVHQSYEGVLCGGIVSTVLDCHAAATAGVALGAYAAGEEAEPVVTKEYSLRFKGPTPIAAVRLVAHATEVERRQARITASIVHEGRVTAELDGVFVCPGRPR